MPLTDKDNNSKIIDLNIDGVERTRIRINGRNDSILELNLSDLGITERLEEGYKKLQDCINQIANLDTESTTFTEELRLADTSMRETIDFIFDAPVSEVCAKGGTMYDPKDGQYRFEAIIDALTKLYTNNLNEEYKALKRRVKQSAEKYLPQDHKPKAKPKRRETVQKDE